MLTSNRLIKSFWWSLPKPVHIFFGPLGNHQHHLFPPGSLFACDLCSRISLGPFLNALVSRLCMFASIPVISSSSFSLTPCVSVCPDCRWGQKVCRLYKHHKDTSLTLHILLHTPTHLASKRSTSSTSLAKYRFCWRTPLLLCLMRQFYQKTPSFEPKSSLTGAIFQIREPPLITDTLFALWLVFFFRASKFFF